MPRTIYNYFFDMKADNLIKGRVYRDTKFKKPESVYLEFSHFGPGQTPYFTHVYGVHEYRTEGIYIVLLRTMPVYEIEPNETTNQNEST